MITGALLGFMGILPLLGLSTAYAGSADAQTPAAAYSLVYEEDFKAVCSESPQYFKNDVLQSCEPTKTELSNIVSGANAAQERLSRAIKKALSDPEKGNALSADICAGAVSEIKANLQATHTELREAVSPMQRYERAFFESAARSAKVLKRYFGLRAFDWDKDISFSSPYKDMVGKPYFGGGLGKTADLYFRVLKDCPDTGNGRGAKDSYSGAGVCNFEEVKWVRMEWPRQSSAATYPDAQKALALGARDWALMGLIAKVNWYRARENLRQSIHTIRQIEFMAAKLGEAGSCQELVAQAGNEVKLPPALEFKDVAIDGGVMGMDRFVIRDTTSGDPEASVAVDSSGFIGAVGAVTDADQYGDRHRTAAKLVDQEFFYRDKISPLAIATDESAVDQTFGTNVNAVAAAKDAALRAPASVAIDTSTLVEETKDFGQVIDTGGTVKQTTDGGVFDSDQFEVSIGGNKTAKVECGFFSIVTGCDLVGADGLSEDEKAKALTVFNTYRDEAKYGNPQVGTYEQDLAKRWGAFGTVPNDGGAGGVDRIFHPVNDKSLLTGLKEPTDGIWYGTPENFVIRCANTSHCYAIGPKSGTQGARAAVEATQNYLRRYYPSYQEAFIRWQREQDAKDAYDYDR